MFRVGDKVTQAAQQLQQGQGRDLQRHRRVAVRRRDPRARNLPRDRVDPLRGDLRAVLIQTHHQRHAITSPSIARTSTNTRTPTAQRAAHRIPSTTVGTSYSNWPAAWAATTRAFLCRSTRRADHLHRRLTPTGTYHLSMQRRSQSSKLGASIACERQGRQSFRRTPRAAADRSSRQARLPAHHQDSARMM